MSTQARRRRLCNAARGSTHPTGVRLAYRIGIGTVPTLVTACGTNPGSTASGEITGIVYSAPSCPAQRLESPCPPRTVAGAEVVALQGSSRRASTHTGSDGRFRLTLSLGHYTIQATNIGGYNSTARKDVDVGTTPVDIELIVDSGIR